MSECGSDLPRTCPATPSGQNGRVSLVGILQQQNGVPALVWPRFPLLPCQQRLGGEMLAEMINTIETGIGIGLFPIIGIGIGIGFKQTLLIGIGIGIGKFLFWLIGFGIGIGKFQGTTIGFGIGIGKIQFITIGFTIGIGKVYLSAIGIGIDCQLLDFPIPIPIVL